MVQYKHTEDKQAKRNERPLSGFVGERGGGTETEGERALMFRTRKTPREEGNSRLDHMTESIVILSEKGLERSISPSGQGKGKKKKNNRERDR